MELTAENVTNLFRKCLRDSGEEVTKGIQIDAYLDTTGHENDIKDLLSQLPDEFQQSKGGGWTFLNACDTKTGVQWTGMHATMEQLVMLGIASNQAAFMLPRDLWEVMPGGMPYFTVKDVVGA